jgi:L-threonylcarbamoyladenylate synthase
VNNSVNEIEIAAQIIKDGGLVAFPTETVYGLGANAFNPLAVAKIFELKARPSFDPLIVHIATFDDIKILTNHASDAVIRLAEKFWPGPLTIVLPKSKLVPDLVTSGLQTVGIRMPNNQIALELIKKAQCPIAAPSANKFGRLSPVSAQHVRKQLPDVDYILDGGYTSLGIESTIVLIEDKICSILRPGIISIDDIEKALPNTFIFTKPRINKLISPGSMKSHYSPEKPLHIIKNMELQLPEFSGLILHGKYELISSSYRTIYTSMTNNKLEIAANLFYALHTLEEDENINEIFIEPVDEVGIGVAIMDRIRKATYKYQSSIN